VSESLASRFTREHRELDRLFERFLGTLSEGDPDAAAAAIGVFDDALRAHTASEGAALGPRAGRKLSSPGPEEDDGARRSRELLLEHVQIRELSGMLRRMLSERRDLPSVPGVASNLARRWDAHTSREERGFGSDA
jgi:hypothetical protein